MKKLGWFCFLVGLFIVGSDVEVQAQEDPFEEGDFSAFFICDSLDDEYALSLAICADLRRASEQVFSEEVENALFVGLMAEVLGALAQENQVRAYLDFKVVYTDHLLSINDQAIEFLALEEQTPAVVEKEEELDAYREAHAAEEASRVDATQFAGLAALGERLSEAQLGRLESVEGLRRKVSKESLLGGLFDDGSSDGPSGTSMHMLRKEPKTKWQEAKWLSEKIGLRSSAVDQFMTWVTGGDPYTEEEEAEDRARLAALQAQIEKENENDNDGPGFFCEVFGWFCGDDDQCPPDEEGCQEDDGEALARLISISCGVFGVCPEELSALSVDDNGGVGVCDPRTGADCGGDVRFLHDTDEPILDAAGGPCDGRGNDENCEPREDNAVDYSALIRSLAACPPDADNCGDFGFDIPVGGPIGPSTAMPVMDTAETVDVEVAVEEEEEVEEIPEDLPETH